MIFDQTLACAQTLDSHDSLAAFRSRFLIPQHDGQDIRYFCGNSLGLQPKSAQTLLQEQLKNWQDLAVEGWFEGESPWMTYHHELQALLAPIVGANPAEVVPMNNLTVNLHLMMVSFYQPKGKRIKILMEGGAFPSDQYAVESHLRFHGINPDEAIVEVFPRAGEETLRKEDILAQINANADELALILFGGINYYTGQLFDMAAITKAGQAAGAKIEGIGPHPHPRPD
jgi:kynureninase